MEGKSQNASGSASAPKSTGSSKPVQREVERSGAIPTNTASEVSGGSHPSTVTLSREVLERMTRLLKPDADPAIVLGLIEADPTPLPTGDAENPEPYSGDTMDVEEFKRMEEGEEVEQQLQQGEAEKNLVGNMFEVIESPARQEVERASALEEEQPLPII